MTYHEKLKEAAKEWLAAHPESKQSLDQVVAQIAKNNALFVNWREPCDQFDYSGTRWCDRCGHEKAHHSLAARLHWTIKLIKDES